MGFFSELFSSSSEPKNGEIASANFSKPIQTLSGHKLSSKTATPAEKSMAGAILGSMEKKTGEPK